MFPKRLLTLVSQIRQKLCSMPEAEKASAYRPLVSGRNGDRYRQTEILSLASHR